MSLGIRGYPEGRKILVKSKSVIPGRRDVPETPDMILTLPIVGLGVSKITGERPNMMHEENT